MSQIDDAARLIADAIGKQEPTTSARWRWGTVESVNAGGTMNVNVGGVTMPGIRAAKHVTGAASGDRVRVAYQGTDAIVDAVRATDDAAPIVYASGETATIAWGGATYITSGTKEVTFDVPTTKLIGGLTPTLTSCTMVLRQGGSYVLGSGSSLVDVTSLTSITDVRAASIRLTYYASSAISGATNNDVVGVYVRVTFKFS